MAKRGRPSKRSKLRQHLDWPLLLEMGRRLQRSGGRGITKITLDLASRAEGISTKESKARRLANGYRENREEIHAALREQEQRAGKEAATTAMFKRIADERQRMREVVAQSPIERALAANPEFQRLLREKEELDRFAKAIDPLAKWRHLLDD
jgi:hypothetical protein